MGKIATDLSAIEKAALKAVQDVLSNDVKPSRLIAKRNKQPHYFTIRLDDERELCYIGHQMSNGNLSYIGCNRKNKCHFHVTISSPNDIYSIKNKLINKLKAIAQEENISLP